MNTAGFLVTLRLPDEIQPEQAIRELQTCITFGHPEVSLQYVIPDTEQSPEIDPKPFPEPYPLPDAESH